MATILQTDLEANTQRSPVCLSHLSQNLERKVAASPTST